MKKMTGKELAKEIGCTTEHLQSTFNEYNKIALGEKKDPFGKKFFHNFPVNVDDDFHVALMEPVLHFTMGGVEINDRAQVINSEGKTFEGLYACGELAGGVHGANRLGGSSLLGCVVYGRVAGDSASSYLFQQALTGQTPALSRLSQISLHLDPNQPGKFSVEWGATSNEQAGSEIQIAKHSQISTAPVMGHEVNSTDSAKVTKSMKVVKFEIPATEYSMEEVAKHNTRNDLWVVVKGVVLDLSDWLEEHPGGPQAIMNFMGRDASEEFAMLHDDEVIPKYAPSQVIGRIKGQEVTLEV